MGVSLGREQHQHWHHMSLAAELSPLSGMACDCLLKWPSSSALYTFITTHVFINSQHMPCLGRLHLARELSLPHAACLKLLSAQMLCPLARAVHPQCAQGCVESPLRAACERGGQMHPQLLKLGQLPLQSTLHLLYTAADSDEASCGKWWRTNAPDRP